MNNTIQTHRNQEEKQKSLYRGKALKERFIKYEEKAGLYEENFKNMSPSEIASHFKAHLSRFQPHELEILDNELMYLVNKPYDCRTNQTVAMSTQHHRGTVNKVLRKLVKIKLLNKVKVHRWSPCFYGLPPSLRDASVREVLGRFIPAFKALCLSVLLSGIPLNSNCQIEPLTHIKKEIYIKNINSISSTGSYINYASKNSSSGMKSIKSLLMDIISRANGTPEVRPNIMPRPLNRQPQRKESRYEKSAMLTENEKKILSLPQSYKQRQRNKNPETRSLSPAHRPYIHKDRKIPHEPIYISYFRLQDHLQKTGNPFEIKNPFREEFIKEIEESCSSAGVSKTEMKQELYNLYLAKKEAGEI